jgi:hypothetical protein
LKAQAANSFPSSAQKSQNLKPRKLFLIKIPLSENRFRAFRKTIQLKPFNSLPSSIAVSIANQTQKTMAIVTNRRISVLLPPLDLIVTCTFCKFPSFSPFVQRILFLSVSSRRRLSKEDNEAFRIYLPLMDAIFFLPYLISKKDENCI